VGLRLCCFANSMVSEAMGRASMVKPTLLAWLISLRLQASPSLESMDAVAAPVFARISPSLSRAWGMRTVSTSFFLIFGGASSSSVNIFSPQEVKPKCPVVATMSPGCAPLRRIRFPFFVVPKAAMLMMRSSVSLVSPPMM